MAKQHPYIIVTNTEPRLHTIALGTAGRVQLKPGANVVPRGEWEAAEKIATVQALLAAGRLKLAGDMPADGLKALSEDRAIALVGESLDLAALRRWSREEQRTGVLRAIDSRLDAIEQAATPIAGAQGDKQPWQGGEPASAKAKGGRQAVAG